MLPRFSRIIIFILLGTASTTLAKSYSIDSIHINAELLANGSLKIEETRIYSFRGSFSWADYHLPLSKVGRVQNFTLTEGDRPYAAAAGKEPGTYQLQADDHELYLKWHYKARNQTRTFTLNYIVTDVATVYDDVAELYFKFVGRANPKTAGQVTVTIKLPQLAAHPTVQAWAHGPLWGEITFKTGKISMWVQPLPAKTFWEARVLMPADWLPAASRRQSGYAQSRIMAKEARLVEQANADRERDIEQRLQEAENQRKALPIAAGLAVVAFLTWGILFIMNGRGFSVRYQQKMDSAIPDNLSPALASYLFFQKNVYGSTLMATLLYLARRGFVTIEQQTRERTFFGFKHKQEEFIVHLKDKNWRQSDKLADYEIALLALLFEELSAGSDSLNMKLFSKNASRIQKWFKEWKKIFAAHFEGQPFWDKKSIKAVIISASVSFAVVVLGIATVTLLGEGGIIAIVAGGICLGLSFTIMRYTAEMKLLRKKLAAFKNYLSKYHTQPVDHATFLNHIQEYLIYGIGLGLSAKSIKKLMLELPTGQYHSYFPWYVGHSQFATPAEFAGAMSSFISVGTTTMSSASGAGGGASGGGGGGGGGAGGGAG